MFLPSNITLKFGDSGDFVAELQRRLAGVSAYPDDQINGFFDGTTVNGVSAFQTRHGLRADGIAGPETLRRLNGVITGTSSSEDTTSSSSTQEEQQAAAVTPMFQPLPNVPPVFGTAPMEVRPDAAPAWSQPEPTHVPAAAPAQEPVSVQQQLQREAQLYQQQQSAQQDQLAQMLMQQTMQSPQHQQAPAAAHAPAVAAAPPNPYAAPTAHAAEPAPAHTPAATPAAEPARGLIGRAMEKMDAMLQKLSSYFEAKLPPDVLREVQHLGQVMLQSGVKESAIPSGPDQVRGPALPARGPEQTQMPQRG